jgi:hypothetical protein
MNEAVLLEVVEFQVQNDEVRIERRRSGNVTAGEASKRLTAFNQRVRTASSRTRQHTREPTYNEERPAIFVGSGRYSDISGDMVCTQLPRYSTSTASFLI